MPKHVQNESIVNESWDMDRTEQDKVYGCVSIQLPSSAVRVVIRESAILSSVAIAESKETPQTPGSIDGHRVPLLA